MNYFNNLLNKVKPGSIIWCKYSNLKGLYLIKDVRIDRIQCFGTDLDGAFLPLIAWGVESTIKIVLE